MEIDTPTAPDSVEKGKRKAEGEEGVPTPQQTPQPQDLALPAFRVIPSRRPQEDPTIPNHVLLAATILNSLAAHPPNVPLFEEYEQDLITFSAIPGKLGQLASKIIGDISKTSQL